MVSSPLPSRADRLTRWGAALAALTALSACGTDSHPGIAIRNAQSDVVFGATAAPATAPPGNNGFVPSGPGRLPDLGPLAPPLSFPSGPPSQGPTGPTGPVASPICPGPPLGSTIPQAASTAVQGQPKPGFYLWQAIRAEDLGNKVILTTAKYTNYEVKNVSPITTRPNPQGAPTTTFTYDQVAPIGKGHTLTYTFQVKQNAPGVAVAPANAVNPIRLAEPDAGIAIAKEVERDADGKEVGSFSPLTPVLLLPLPIVGGQSFTGTGLDPTTGSSMQVQGTVKGPARVLSCSQFIQGYRVEATVTSQSGSGDSFTGAEAFTLETQTGGLLIGASQTPTGSKVTTSSIVGSNTPSTKPVAIPKDQAL